MANPEHVATLKQRIGEWNAWRAEHPFLMPDLSGANLSRADLSDANLSDANLSGADLSNADLSSARLSGADLSNADLSNADLSGANLFGADLKGFTLDTCDFSRATLSNTCLYGASLRHAIIREPQHLQSAQLGGTDLTHAELPESLREFKALGFVSQAIQDAGKLLDGLLLACVYCWLTLATTNDATLVDSGTAITLPIINTPVPVRLFFIATPALLLVLFGFYHVQSQRVWEVLADLPAILPDGVPIDRRTPPSMMLGLLGALSPRLNKPLLPLTCFRACAATLMAWGVIPFTLGLFWFRYLPLSEAGVTLFHALLLAIACGFGLYMFCLMVRTLTYGATTAPKRAQRRNRTTAVLACVAIGTILVALISLQWAWFDTGAPPTFARLRFSNLAVSQRPDSQGGALLSHRYLAYCNAENAYLARADLTGANLHGAKLTRANLEGANLEDTDLSDAELYRATLTGANLKGADLSGANLQDTDLSGANPLGANLMGVLLEGASYSKETIWPPDYDPTASGARLVSDD